jgi:hypothetical protein
MTCCAFATITCSLIPPFQPAQYDLKIKLFSLLMSAYRRDKRQIQNAQNERGREEAE